jgi:hypothetical protein
MSATDVAELSEDQLGRPGRVLGRGGQAFVHDLPDLQLPDERRPLVYKRYREGMGPSRANVAALIARRRALPGLRRDRLDEVTAWPLAAVVDDSDLLGVVLPLIPAAYFQDVVLPSGAADKVIREVQHLFVSPDRNARIGMPTPTAEQRLRICRDLADVLSLLHSDDLQIAFGDLNAKNELFRLDAEPTVMLVDCDAARVRGDMGVQPNTPDWLPPPPGEPLSRVSDCYKLALFVLRCLTPGPQGSTRTDPGAAAGVVDGTGVDLLEAAILGPRDQRPSAIDWYRYLTRLLGEPLDPPTLGALVPDRTLVAAGEPMTVHWTAQDAEVVELTAVGCDPVVVDGRAGSGAAALHPARTGSIRVVARNRHGTVAAGTPPVMVAGMPEWADLPVPMARMNWPAADGFPVPGIAGMLPPLPPVGAVGLPSLAEPVDAWMPPELPPIALLVGGPGLGSSSTTRGRAVR